MHNKYNTKFSGLSGFVTFCLLGLPSYAQDNPESGNENLEQSEQTEIDSNPEGWHEAGFGIQIPSWLTMYGYLEAEKIYRQERYEDNVKIDEDDRRSHTLYLSFDAELTESLEATVGFEADYQSEWDTYIDEAYLSYEYEDLSLEIGCQGLPFGEYNSYFISGSLLDFGETSATSLIVDYSLSDSLDLIGYVFDGQTRQLDDDTDLGWGLTVEFTNEDESVSLGVGYLSNLAESDEQFLFDFDDSYINKVPAWSINGLIALGDFELIAEYVFASEPFDEFDSDEDQPSAFNVELAWYIHPNIQLALKLENSDEFFGEPQWQYGFATTWRVNEQLTVATEYLTADYKKNFVFNDDDQELQSHHQYGILINFEF